MQKSELEYKGMKFEGLSLAGVRTCITVPQYSISFDVAQGFPFALPMNNFLITHGHMDHASGIPYIISQKAMNSHIRPRFFMPPTMVQPMKEIMNNWSLIEGHKYDFELIGIDPLEMFEIRPNIFIKPFRTIHRLPSQGYSVIRKFKKLKASLEGASRQEISHRIQSGEDVTEIRSEILISFTGDTQIECLIENPEILQSKILFLEATYLDERKPVSSAKEWGHTHLDEIIPMLDQIESNKIVLIHTSARYSYAEAQALIASKIPKAHSERVVLFPGR